MWGRIVQGARREAAASGFPVFSAAGGSNRVAADAQQSSAWLQQTRRCAFLCTEAPTPIPNDCLGRLEFGGPQEVPNHLQHFCDVAVMGRGAGKPAQLFT